MRIEFVEGDNEVSFELHDVDPSLDTVLANSFWQRDQAVWHRPYPRSAPHLERVMATFTAHAEEMFQQMAYGSWHPAGRSLLPEGSLGAWDAHSP